MPSRKDHYKYKYMIGQELKGELEWMNQWMNELLFSVKYIATS